MTSPRIKNALISVSDKMGLTDFARGLISAGITIYSTGGTRRHLEAEGIEVLDVSAYTEFPEMMDGRLKTLHPKVFGGILCRHDRSDDMDALADHNIETFALVVVNLYPFETTIARDGVTMAEAIEQIDIGGPSLVRAAAKNHAFTTIVTHTNQYADVLQQIAGDEAKTTLDLRRQLAGAAFTHTARYDRAIADYFAGQTSDGPFPATLNVDLRRKTVLRYGENPHQPAALYAERNNAGANLVTARQLNGKELSYNNLLDLDAALAIARSLPGIGAAVLKHNNPCGAAIGDSLAEAMRKALDGDPVSAFGSVIGVNRSLDAETAEVLAEPGRFVEAIVAPEFSPAAIEILTTKPKWKANVRLMQVGDLTPGAEWQVRHLDGGLLMQHSDMAADIYDNWKVVTETEPSDAQMADLRFAWAVVRHVKSNAIVLAKEKALCGVGAGQMSRVDSVEISINKAGDQAAGSVLASDAFFPFADSIHRAAEAGITALIEPGGSRRDDEVIAACNEHGLPMIFTGKRHFKH